MLVITCWLGKGVLGPATERPKCDAVLDGCISLVDVADPRQSANVTLVMLLTIGLSEYCLQSSSLRPQKSVPKVESIQ